MDAMNEFPDLTIDGWILSTDKNRIDEQVVHRYLCEESYWAKGIPFSTVQRSIAHSLCLGAYVEDGSMAGFGRMITDQATFAYLCDVFVRHPYRGQGLSKLMMQYFCMMADKYGLRRFLLTTQDAHGLYQQFGFTTFPWPERLMSRKGVQY